MQSANNTIAYFKEDGLPDFWLSSRACPEIGMEFLAIYTHGPTVILGRDAPYSVYNATEAEKRGIALNRIFVLPPQCAAYLDEGVLTWTLFIETNEWTEKIFLEDLIAWEVKSLKDLGINIDPGPILKLDGKILGVTGLDTNHTDYLLGAGILNISVDHEAAEKLVNLDNIMQQEQAGLKQLGYKITKDQLRDHLAANFEAFFKRTLRPTNIEVIQTKLDELKAVYYSENWVKYGELESGSLATSQAGASG